MKASDIGRERLAELLLQALETERAGVEVYRAALASARNEALRDEWQGFLEETERHERILFDLCLELGINAAQETPGREAVRHLGRSLVQAMELALARGAGETAELVAAECVVLAESKDHLNWELIGEVARSTKGEEAKALRDAQEAVEEEEDSHLYHAMGWARELWLDALGLEAVLPPPEEARDVKTATGAERARKARTRMLRGRAST
jgi:hypothetical protein